MCPTKNKGQKNTGIKDQCLYSAYKTFAFLKLLF
jgi:hypothetical protein